jgi:hypothetical protein
VGQALYREHTLESVNIQMGFSQEFVVLVGVGFKFSKLGSV